MEDQTQTDDEKMTIKDYVVVGAACTVFAFGVVAITKHAARFVAGTTAEVKRRLAEEKAEKE